MQHDTDLPIPKEISLVINHITYDVTELFKNYENILVDEVTGNLWFMKDQLQLEDAIRIEAGKSYYLEGIVQIQRMSKGTSLHTLNGLIY
jgi:hypothetical protein